MTNIISALFPFFVILVSGWIFRLYKKPVAANETRKIISQLVLNIFLPALFFKIMITTDFQTRLFLIPTVCSIMIVTLTLFTSGFYAFLEKLLGTHFSKEFKGAMVLCCGFANITFLGMPILTSLFGPLGQSIAIFHDVFSTGPLIYSYGALIALWYGSGSDLFNKNNKKLLLKTITNFLTFPPFIAAVLGVILKFLGLQELPTVAIQTLDLTGKAVSPLMIFCVGLALEIPSSKKDLKETTKILPGIFIKLVLAPAIAFCIYHWIGCSLTPLEKAASILEMAMPTMVVTIMLCDQFSLSEKTAAQMIAITTLLSFLTLPFWIYCVNI